MKFGAIMQACRERAGLTQEQIADKLHKSRSCISKLENDMKTPDLPTMMRWADITGAREVVVSFMYGMDGISIMQNLMQVAGS
ncbi:helix-turn-helix transcriptional regulator [Paenibacillus alba]|uniref:helix-turn-helix domain-containing protein n=1 Tax=Paenibacillus alba TaxID=1197127 RepID=UPI001565066E|nr:helix-turn-helix transcriptional regulator [Paenibacillus alba]NQX68462.1 helix-turn-helix transcriptional regulator [Paenibacillus alba]